MKGRDVHFRLDKEAYAVLKAAAKAEDRSAAYLVTRIVRDWVTKHPTLDDCVAWEEERLKRR